MDVSAESNHALTGAGTPRLELDGFAGPLDHLLALARAQSIDLGRLSLTALLDQLGTAVRQAPPTVPLGQKGDWVVMAAWLVQLRSLLLLPADAPAHQDAVLEADALRQRLVALDEAQALAGWLEHQPLDVIEFLWASMALFEDAAADTAPVYRPVVLNLHAVGEARARMRRLLAQMPDGAPLARFLPEPDTPSVPTPHATLRRRSAWASTFIAGLELTKQGEVVMGQAGIFSRFM